MKKLVFLATLILSVLLSKSQPFEGELHYKLLFVPKAENIDVKNLEFRYGNRMTVFVKKGLYKSVRFNEKDTIETAICNNLEGLKYFCSLFTNFYVTRSIENETPANLTKYDTAAVVQNVDCNVYKYTQDKTETLFFIEKNSNTPDENYRYHTLVPFTGPVLKVIVRNPYYLTIITLESKSSYIPEDKVFNTSNIMKVSSEYELIKPVITLENKQKLARLVLSKMTYPSYLKRKKIVGKINVNFIVDGNGMVNIVQTEPVFFRKYLSYNNISNKDQLLKILLYVDKELQPAVSLAIQEIKMEKPVSKDGKPVSTVVQIPLTLTFDKEFSDVPDASDDERIGEEHIEFSYDDDDFN